MRRLIYEFVIPSQVCLVDQSPWPPLRIAIDGANLYIDKPAAGTKHLRVDNTLGNEGVVVDYSVLRVSLEREDELPDLEWFVPFHYAKECLAWIRVVGRQYWLGVLMSASDSFARGSIIYTKDSITNFTNFGASKMRLPPTPLSLETWKIIGNELASGRRPSIPDVMFCDALLSFRDDDYFQTVIQLGVTCELELNALIEDLLILQSEPLRKLYGTTRRPFEWKLKDMPAILGIESYGSRNVRFAGLLCNLYAMRGTAVHRGQCLMEEKNSATGKQERVPVNFNRAAQFIFAVQDFLDWAKDTRRKAGLTGAAPTPPTAIPYMIGPAS